MKYTMIVASVIISCVISMEAGASQIVYRGINPEITPTANPLNETAISNFSALTRPSSRNANAFATLTEAQLLKQSVIGGLSTTYQQILTGKTSSSGTVNFGDGSYADYTTSGDVRYITFYDLNGSSTQISFPIN